MLSRNNLNEFSPLSPELLLDLILISNTILISIPILLIQPTWITFACILLWIFLILTKLKLASSVNSWIPSLLSAFFFYLVYLEYKTLIGQEAGSTLLVLLASLKLYEVRNSRDRIIHLLLSLCVIMAWAVDVESIFQTIYMLFCFLSTCSLLKAIQLIPQTLREYFLGLRLSVKAFLYSLPILLVFFFFFPRFVSPFTRYLPSNEAKSGFTDTLEPGDLSKLVKSQDIAFRVKFSPGTRQLKRFLYWRGLVLDKTDGFKWWREKDQKHTEYIPQKLQDTDLKKPFNAEVFYENRFEGWLFHFDNTYEITPLYPNERLRIIKRYGDTYQHTGSPLPKLRYNFSFGFGSSFGSDSMSSQDEPSVIVPTMEISEEIKALSQDLKSKTNKPSESAQNILNYFKQNKFKYTLEPGKMKNLNDFLFKTKLGFCEHYASTTAILLNQMGIPARIVIGYQGGTLNTYGFYWVVRDQDAHAWVEYFSEENKWTRLDPTSVVAPLRLEFGGSILAETTNYDEDLNSFLREYEASWIKALSNEAFLFFDNLNNQYTMFMLNYDFYSQIEVIKNLGIEVQDRSGLIAILIVLSILAYFIFYYLMTYQKDETEEVLKHYMKFCRTIEKITSIPKKPHQGPLDYKNSVVEKYPELQESFEKFYKVFLPLRYAHRDKSKKDLKDLYTFINETKKVKISSAYQD